MNKDILGTALYNVRNTFNNKTYDELITLYGTIEAARLAEARAEADEIIKHIQNNAILTTTGKGLVAGTNAVTGTSTSNIIQ